jgi:hypothetical protein
MFRLCAVGTQTACDGMQQFKQWVICTPEHTHTHTHMHRNQTEPLLPLAHPDNGHSYYLSYNFVWVGRDSAVGIATRYGLGGLEIESRWKARFSAPVQTGPGAQPASYTMGTVPFPGVKRPGRGVDHPPHLAPRLIFGIKDLFVSIPTVETLVITKSLLMQKK